MAHVTPGGIKKQKGTSDEMTVPEFAMPPDAVPGIAQFIVNVWTGAPGLDKILDRIHSGPKKGMARQEPSTSDSGNQCSDTGIQFEALRNNQGNRAR